MNEIPSKLTSDNISENEKNIKGMAEYLENVFKANGKANISFSPQEIPEYIGILLRDLIINILTSNRIVFEFDSGGVNKFPQLSRYNEITQDVFSELEKHFKVGFNYIDINSDLPVDENKIIKSVKLIETQINDLAKIISKAMLNSLKKINVDLKQEDIEKELLNQLSKYFLLKFEKYSSVGKLVNNVGKVVRNITN